MKKSELNIDNNFGMSEKDYQDLDWWFDQLFEVTDMSIFEEDSRFEEVFETMNEEEFEDYIIEYYNNLNTAWQMFHDDINDAIDEYNELNEYDSEFKPLTHVEYEDD
jgi:hypothetical protein